MSFEFWNWRTNWTVLLPGHTASIKTEPTRFDIPRIALN
jgi:hypothetical protein